MVWFNIRFCIQICTIQKKANDFDEMVAVEFLKDIEGLLGSVIGTTRVSQKVEVGIWNHLANN